MKTHLTLLLLLCLGCLSVAHAQPAAFVLSSDKGEPLQVYVNGLLVNDKPTTHIFSGPLDPGTQRVRIVVHLGADDEEIIRNFHIEPGVLVYYSVRQNNRGQYIARAHNMVENWTGDIPDGYGPAGHPHAHDHGQDMRHENPNPHGNSPQGNPGNNPPNKTGTTHTTRVNTMGLDTQIDESEDGVDVRVNFGGINMDVSARDHGSATTHTQMHDGMGGTGSMQTQTDVNTHSSSSSANTRRGACPAAMSDAAFKNALSSIKSKDFEDTKFSVAKQVLNSNCLFSKDIADICNQFDFEQTRLDFAKLAYGRTFDPENYFVVNDVFDFDSSVEELTAFIARQRR